MNTKRYTANPNEVPVQNTVPAPADVVALLQSAWPELSRTGARTLTAQFLHETGGARYCFNWNLGNVKSADTEPHMYLANVWEVVALANVTAETAKGGRVATDAECRAHGWAHNAISAVVVFQPPHPQCRFRAYASLADGAQRWITLHRKVAASHPEYLPALNAGDCTAAARILKFSHYYTGDEGAYARSMAALLSGVL